MALMHLAAAWAAQNGAALRVATVDHGLRLESAAEAGLVAQAATALGLPHDTLRWNGWDGGGNLQDAARHARRRLIEDWAEALGIDTVLTGHTADDQAETVLMRLARGSGVDGLAGIAASERHKVRWLRPLLDVPRADLRDYLGQNDIGWIDDPFNDDPRFDRVKTRKLLEGMENIGLSRQRLTETARHMQAAREVLDAAMAELGEKAVTQDRGDLLIDMAAFRRALPDTRTRLLARALIWLSQNRYRPRFAPLSQLEQRLCGTLHGCLITARDGTARITREYQSVRRTTCASDALWDNRWRLTGPHAPGQWIGALGETGLAECPAWRDTGAPRVSLLASPAIWQDNRLISAPLAGLMNGWRAELAHPAADFRQSLLSH
ncbi:MAG: tRNA lysidine(34) synthetase TilS [Rhodobacteraceae bacterium]|nr:tRNA lysidine(34) synthetase TilS [Paracoccaceae bacterium]